MIWGVEHVCTWTFFPSVGFRVAALCCDCEDIAVQFPTSAISLLKQEHGAVLHFKGAWKPSLWVPGIRYKICKKNILKQIFFKIYSPFSLRSQLHDVPSLGHHVFRSHLLEIRSVIAVNKLSSQSPSLELYKLAGDFWDAKISPKIPPRQSVL